MQKLRRDELMSLEEYHRERPQFRARVIEHKQSRQVAIGPNATLYFEDRLTIQYQIQEMLRIERVFEAEGIDEELAAYNPLIPDGSNFKATFMLEFPDVEKRRAALEQLTGVERHIYCEVDDIDRVYAIADEDLERTTDEKTSAVHFLRFELSADARAALAGGAALHFGSDHPRYEYRTAPLSDSVRASLLADLD